MIKHRSLCALALALFVLGAASGAQAVKAGSQAPSFALNTLDGKRATLEGLLKNGKPLLISFFATWCKPCNQEIPDIKKIAAEGKLNVVLISLDMDAPLDEIKKWVADREVAHLMTLHDPKGIAGERFGVVSGGGRAQIPHVYMISPSQKIIWEHDGLDEKLSEHVSAAADEWISKKEVVSNKETAPRDSFWVFFTNSANGWLVYCECPQQPLGGLSRRATYLEEARNRYEPALFLDTGDNFSGKADEKRCRHMAEAFGYLSYDAMVPGDQEFVMGAKFALDKVLIPEKPYLTANLGVCPNKKLCTLPYQGYKIVEKGGLKIGLIGIFHEDTIAFAPEELQAQLKVFPLDKKLPAALKAVKPKSDVVILLSHSGFVADQGIAKQYPEIDIIVGGHSQDLLKTPMIVGSVKIVQAGPGGQYVGKMLVSKENGSVTIKKYELVPMTLDYEDHPKIAEVNARYQEELKGN
ncbi:MAG: redoxin domain-containing protein [Elusimicrobia bacterium]|nr:redoxin domain-containing protein [Elusimicrobiota bacterium]